MNCTLLNQLCIGKGFLALASVQETCNKAAVALSCADAVLHIVETDRLYDANMLAIFCLRCSDVSGKLPLKLAACEQLNCRFKLSDLMTATVCMHIKHVGFALAWSGKKKQYLLVHSVLNWRFSWSTFLFLANYMLFLSCIFNPLIFDQVVSPWDDGLIAGK